jgi:hypothetical protein
MEGRDSDDDALLQSRALAELADAVAALALRQADLEWRVSGGHAAAAGRRALASGARPEWDASPARPAPPPRAPRLDDGGAPVPPARRTTAAALLPRRPPAKARRPPPPRRPTGPSPATPPGSEEHEAAAARLLDRLLAEELYVERCIRELVNVRV